MNKNEINKVLGSEMSKSKKMIELYNGGLGIKEISELMKVRYNFVYNVVSNMCRINDVELRVKKKGDGVNKKDMIIKMLNDGKECIEISKELKSNINYVYKIRKELEVK